MELTKIQQYLELDEITDRPWTILSCSAINKKGIDDAFTWLVKTIDSLKNVNL